MIERIIEHPPTPGHRCICCRDIGLHCADTAGGRIVVKTNGTQEEQLVIGASIQHCLQSELVDQAISDTPDPSEAESLDNTEEVEDATSYAWHVDRNQYWQKLLLQYHAHFLAPSGDSERPQKLNEPNGVASELIVHEVLSDFNRFPWIESARLVKRSSKEDGNGIDIVVTLSPEIADLLTNDGVYVQVKSDPGSFGKFIDKYERKHRLKEGEGVDRLLDNFYILLNGGAGRVSDAGIIGPFLAQLYQLISLHNSVDAAEVFLEQLSPQIQEILTSTTTKLILNRDYWMMFV